MSIKYFNKDPLAPYIVEAIVEEIEVSCAI